MPEILDQEQLENALKKIHLENARLEERIKELEAENQSLQSELIEKQKKELAGLESEAKFQAMFNQSGVGVALFNLQGKFVEANPAIVDLSGYSAEELMRMSFTDITFSDDRETGVKQFLDMLEGKISRYTVERRYRHKDGSTIYGISQISMVRIPGSPEPFVMAQVVNISEFKAMQRELREKEKKHKLVMDALGFGLWDWDIVRGSVYYNPAWAAILEEEAVDPAYESWESRIHPDDRDRVLNSINNHLQGLTPVWLEEHRLKTSKGHWKWVKGQGRVVERLKNEAPLRMIGTMADIDERKKVENTLYKTTRILEETIQQAPYAMFIMEGSVGNARLLIANEMARGFMDQFTAEDAGGRPPDPTELGCHLYSYMDEKEIASDRKPLIRALAGESIKNERFYVLDAQGEKIPMEINAFPVYGKSGNIVAVPVTLFDISKTLEAEKDRLQMHKLEAVGTLAGGISHDFNNILSIIIGHAEIVSDEVSKDGQAYQSINAILEACLRARDVVKQLLDFARKAETDLKPMAVTPVIQESLTLLRSSIPARIEIKTHLTAKNDVVMAAPPQIKQVLINLCTNASQAIKSGGEIKISTDNLELSSPWPGWNEDAVPGPCLRLMIEDSGEGMDPAIAHRALEPYFTTKDVGKGAGMGLPVVHGLIKSMGGFMRVSSGRRKGVKVEIILPLAEVKKPTKTVAAKERPARKAKNVLVVDDEKALIVTQKAMLERQGYDVVGETDALKALEIFRANPGQFDLAIVDMSMPGINGDAFARELKKLRADIPIVLATGYSDEASMKRIRSLDVDVVINKPMTRSDLSQAINAALKQHT
ncbi:PAS/PAC sensor hybrid histidine kinase [Desulfatibacillum aliphaticivorans]|uniref:histidine kinase n=1 Tax=Desulfatibacillum aliphaticivorans TaxID=218208 RepID=B8FK57_DESAL|nr:PAS domain S-box protein [Desulfatibacillum aliphaticivorans]ACL02732.1 PAS/PAC sensor hybrid histidine kinase [Desulfatibacillum aliphaticivorans]